MSLSDMWQLLSIVKRHNERKKNSLNWEVSVGAGACCCFGGEVLVEAMVTWAA